MQADTLSAKTKPQAIDLLGAFWFLEGLAKASHRGLRAWLSKVGD
jgi:hypothetical protein